jgi:hypothetical protein
VPVEKKSFCGEPYYFRNEGGTLTQNEKVKVYLELVNDEASGLGMPLPKGTVRVYKKDSAGAEQFAGEDSIDHTPKDERVKLFVGEAFDVVADRTQTEWRMLHRARRSSCKIAIRIARTGVVTVRADRRDWAARVRKSGKLDAEPSVHDFGAKGKGGSHLSRRRALVRPGDRDGGPPQSRKSFLRGADLGLCLSDRSGESPTRRSPRRRRCRQRRRQKARLYPHGCQDKQCVARRHGVRARGGRPSARRVGAGAPSAPSSSCSTP